MQATLHQYSVHPLIILSTFAVATNLLVKYSKPAVLTFLQLVVIVVVTNSTASYEYITFYF